MSSWVLIQVLSHLNFSPFLPAISNQSTPDKSGRKENAYIFGRVHGSEKKEEKETGEEDFRAAETKETYI